MYATEFQLDSISALIETAIHNTRQVTNQSNNVIKAFNKTIAPVLVENAKGFSQHWFESECYWRQRLTNLIGVTHNPLTASIRAAHAELTSPDAIATYRRLQHITRESAMDVLVMGLCGVVAVAQGVEAAQKVYGFAKRVYHWVDDRLNPPLEQPTLLPTVDLCFAHLSDAELAARIENLADPSPLEGVDDAIASHPEPAPLQPAQAEDGPTEVELVDSHPASIVWNPAPKDIHAEVQQRLKTMSVTEASADALSSHATVPHAPFALMGTLDVPGATGGKRNTKGKAKHKQRKEDAGAVAISPRRERKHRDS